MELNESRNIVKTLAQGVHPTTGEVFSPDSPYNDPLVIRALFTVHDFVRQAKKPKMTAGEKRRANLEFGRPGNAGLPWSEEPPSPRPATTPGSGRHRAARPHAEKSRGS